MQVQHTCSTSNFSVLKPIKIMRALMGELITQLEVVLYIILTVAIIHLKTKNWHGLRHIQAEIIR